MRLWNATAWIRMPKAWSLTVVIGSREMTSTATYARTLVKSVEQFYWVHVLHSSRLYRRRLTRSAVDTMTPSDMLPCDR